MAMAYMSFLRPSVGVAVHGDLTMPARVAHPAVHARTVEIHGVVAVAVQRDHAALAAAAFELVVDHGAYRRLERHVLVGHHRADVVGDHLADVELALAGAGGRARLAGIGAGADDRRVAHTSVELVGDTAGRRAGG